MELNFSEAEISFRDEVRAFIAMHLSAEAINAQSLTTSVFPEPAVAKAWHRALFERGWVAPAWPVEYGGTGWSPVQRYLFDAECARAGAPIVSPLGIRMVGPVIIGYGSAEQKAYYLPRILSGEDYWCQGYSEPSSGSDLASLKTRATRDGDDYVVNGTKIWTTHAHHANRMFALVRTNDTERKQDGISFVLIDMKTPGISIRPILTIGGEHEVNQVFLDDVRVPVANRVGDEGKGWTYGKYLLEFERGGTMAASRLRRELSKVEVAATRMSTGEGRRPADSDAIRSKIVLVENDIDALEMIELQVMSALQTGKNPGAISSLLKLRNSEIKQAITALGVEAIGIDGIAWPARRPLYDVDPAEDDPLFQADVLSLTSTYLNTRAATIFGGASEIQRDIMAKTMLGI